MPDLLELAHCVPLGRAQPRRQFQTLCCLPFAKVIVAMLAPMCRPDILEVAHSAALSFTSLGSNFLRHTLPKRWLVQSNAFRALCRLGFLELAQCQPPTLTSVDVIRPNVLGYRQWLSSQPCAGPTSWSWRSASR